MNRLLRYPFLLVYVLCFYAVFAVVKVLTALGLPRRRKASDVKSVLFLECMGPPSAGYRHRSMGWVKELTANGMKAECWYVIPYPRQWKLQQTQTGILRLHFIYLFKRLVQCYKSASFDAVIVRREILIYNDYGNLFFEKWMLRMHTRLILDADDDISAAKREPRNISTFGRLMMEHSSKFKSSLQYFDKAIVGSEYLRNLFASWKQGLNEDDITVLPACVDYYKHRRKDYSRQNETTVIGWVGSAYSLHNLYNVYPALETISKIHNINVLVVCNEPPKQAPFPVTFIPWSQEQELDNLMKIDIGIMPLADSDVSKGKGGFKLIQYMGCAIVSVATNVTINADIIEDGVNGFLVNRQSDWANVLDKVLNRKHEFEAIGRKAADTVRDHYSYEAKIGDFMSVLSADVPANKSSHQPVK